MILFISADAETITVHGYVEDATGVKISAVLVQFINEYNWDTTSTISDDNGRYEVDLEVGSVSIKEKKIEKADKFRLYQNHPNPFNPGTHISFELPEQAKVKITVYDLLGRKIKVLTDTSHPAGKSEICWDGTNRSGCPVSAGIYFYMLESERYRESRKMLLLDGGSSYSNSNTDYHPLKIINKISKDTNTDKYTITATKDGYHSYREKSWSFSSESDGVRKDLNLYLLDSLKLFVVESDQLLSFRGRETEISNFRHTLIINCEEDSIDFSVYYPIPDSLMRTTSLSPSFGYPDAMVPFDYKYYYDFPEISETIIEGEPDDRIKGFTWDSLRFGYHDLIHILWRNYYSDEVKDCCPINMDQHQYLNLQVNSHFFIQNTFQDTTCFVLGVQPEIKNVGEDTLFAVRVKYHIPRKLRNYSDPSNSYWMELYDLLTDSIYGKDPETDSYSVTYMTEVGRFDGFLNSTNGQEIVAFKDTLAPGKSLRFTYEMQIKPLHDRFEIYPFMLVHLEEPTEDHILPASIITTANHIEYRGPVKYLRTWGSTDPAYCLFSIDGDSIEVMDPADSDTTFYYPVTSFH